jgi:hypothetical protein
MASRRQRVAVIWTAIVMIVAALLPQTARAHAGHSHVRQPVVRAAHSEHSGPEQSHTAPSGSRRAAIVEARAGHDRTTTSPACPFDCCTTGFSCCVPAMLPDAQVDLSAPLNGPQVIRPESLTRRGIDPETLSKPPRSYT